MVVLVTGEGASISRVASGGAWRLALDLLRRGLKNPARNFERVFGMGEGGSGTTIGDNRITNRCRPKAENGYIALFKNIDQAVDPARQPVGTRGYVHDLIAQLLESLRVPKKDLRIIH